MKIHYKKFPTAELLCDWVNDNNIEVKGVAGDSMYSCTYVLFFTFKEEKKGEHK